MFYTASISKLKVNSLIVYCMCGFMNVLLFIGFTYKSNSYFGIGYKPIIVYDSRCSTGSVNFNSCYLNWIPSSYCNNYHEAGVICECAYLFPFPIVIITLFLIANTCTNGQVRLKDSDSQHRGNVQVCINGTWGEVCGQGNSKVDNNFASVVCSELGYSFYGISSVVSQYLICSLQVPEVLLVFGTFDTLIVIIIIIIIITIGITIALCSISIILNSLMYNVMGMNQVFLTVNMIQ